MDCTPRTLPLFLWFLWLTCSCAAAADRVDFNRDVRPILTEHCFQCHGPDEDQLAAELRLDLEAVAKQSAIVAGQPDASPLVARVESADADERMPPSETGKTLSDKQLAVLRKWVQQGASYAGHWAWQPVRAAEPPPLRSELESVAVTEIDHFVLAKLQQAGLQLTPPASRQQWLRRASIGLTGLPPTWEQVEAFLSDQSPDAFAKAIDRLLESPRYGERWGRHWLDLARYADTHGGSAIGFKKFPFSYTYRDYVIRSLNDDKPYDRFVTEQIAADQLGLPENDPDLAGLGFLTVGMQFRNQHDIIDDRIDVVTRGLMGITAACARCHDHKYDPIPTADYYALYATFASSRTPRELPLVGAPPSSAAYESYLRQLQQRQIVHADMQRDQVEVMRGRLRTQVGLYLRELAENAPEQDLASAFLSYRTDDLRPMVLNRWRDYLAKLSPEDPVFGPWLQLKKLQDQGEWSAAAAAKLIAAWKQANGDPKKFAAQHRLATTAPRWNPRVLDALEQQPLESMLDVADAYGKVFAAAHQQWLKSLLAASLEAARGGQVTPDQDVRHAAINSAIAQQLRRHLYHPGTPTAMSDEDGAKLLNRTVRDNLRGKAGAIHNLHLNAAGSPPRAMALEEMESAGGFYVFRRGNPIDRGAPVEARFLSLLSTDPAPFPPGKRRLSLAKAIVSPDNPLTRRVLVNWVWRLHFGRGLVRTADDFGSRSEPPTHPALLDYLAAKFAEDGWSIKQLHQRIMLSAVYRQGSVEDAEARQRDPDNRWLWRMPRRRLDMESMRDSMLAVSGELDTAVMGGRPFDFEQQPAVPRRSVYGFVNRDIISSIESTFDRANPTTCTAKRTTTTVPQQTLFALNSNFVQDRAAAFAQRFLKQQADSADVVHAMYRAAFGRDPAKDELQQCLEFLGEQPSNARWQHFAHALLASNEFHFVD